MLTGFKGVKYGLQVPKKEGMAVPKKSLAAFADDDSDDDAQKIARDIERQAQRKQSDKKACNLPLDFSSTPANTEKNAPPSIHDIYSPF